MAAGNDFMGPALWPADRELFVEEDKKKELGPHLDMLHSTPFCMGIAWEKGNRYWAFNGQRGALDMADFAAPHEPGGDDHSDGVKLRMLDGELARVPNVPSHMQLDHATGWLYIADTGNNRIVAVDIDSGTIGDKIFGNFDPGTTLHMVDGVASKTVVEGRKKHLEHPSGLVLHDGLIYVSDHSNGQIRAFTMDGEDVATLETGRTGVMGLTVSPDGELLFVDFDAEELVRVVATPRGGGHRDPGAGR
jgi:outer membrane protein assembly factor BamB